MTSLLLGLLVVSAAPAPWKLASPSWQVTNAKADLAGFYADSLAQALRKQGIQVVTAAEIGAIISAERQKQLLGCGDESVNCMAELGNALGVDGLLLVSLAKLDESYRANVKVVAASDGKVLAETIAEGDSEKKMLQALEESAVAIGASLESLRPQAPVAAGGLRSKAWIPAAAGVALVGAGAALLVVARGQYDEELRVLGDTRLTPDARLTQARAAASQGAPLQTVGWIGVGVGSAALVGAGAMFLFGANPPVSVQAMVTGDAVMVGASGAFP